MKVAIIGAGPAGIATAAALLKRSPTLTVEIFEKNPLPGGRMASENFPGIGVIDTGCQFLSIDNPMARELFETEIPQTAFKQIPAPILCVPDGFVIEPEGRFYFEGGMANWAQHKIQLLSKTHPNFKIHLGIQIRDTQYLASQGFDTFFVSAPGQQGKLLGAKGTVEYHPCLTLVMSWHNAPPEALEYYGFRDIDNREGISWLAHESLKHGTQGIWVAQVTPHTSKLWNRAGLNVESLEDLVSEDLGKWIPLFGKGEKTLIRSFYWDAAFPVQFEDVPKSGAFERQLVGPNRIYFVGDGYRGFGRTENALESALAAVNDLFETQ